MSELFSPIKIGNIRIKNRFVHSATYEAMAKENGEATDAMAERYGQIAKGQAGLIIPGHLYVHPVGRSMHTQAGIHLDDMIPGLKKIVDAVHKGRSKIIFQLSHAGGQTTRDVIGQAPVGPSSKGRELIYLDRPKKLNEEEILDIIRAFSIAARRAVEAGVDGVQLNAGIGQLLNQFLSPYYNRRRDYWGGSDENRFRLLRNIILEVRKQLPTGMPLIVKLNTYDYTPREGITPELAMKYASWLRDLSIDGVEITSGTSYYSFMKMCRGSVPVDEMLQVLPAWQRPAAKLYFKLIYGKDNFQEGYNLEAVKKIKPILGNIPLFIVGGLKKVSQMEEILENKYADFISMSRPFIKDPHIVKKFKKEEETEVTCTYCNKCLAAVGNNMPLKCYDNGS